MEADSVLLLILCIGTHHSMEQIASFMVFLRTTRDLSSFCAAQARPKAQTPAHQIPHNVSRRVACEFLASGEFAACEAADCDEAARTRLTVFLIGQITPASILINSSASSPLPMTTVEPTKQPDFLLCFTLKEYIVAKQKEQENDDKGLARLFPGRLARTVPDSPTSDRSAECGLAWDSEAFDIPFDVGFDDLFSSSSPFRSTLRHISMMCDQMTFIAVQDNITFFGHWVIYF
ncbi:hypothetical protein PAPYR_13231 [Paratrimastix pyriformis]|uniref:Uncharacterized protein n=1 Tax=Paratrimastix pyriformis TaxID=342808 RepID=A0ABQ8U455_9EUKA|nr:hypothetical protein PAPYR_13231 [Paratrimastix pyriformis]